MTTHLSDSSSPDRSRSLALSLSLALSPTLCLPLATSLRVSPRSHTRNLSSRYSPPPTCKPRPLPLHLLASRPHYLSHSLQPLDLINRCQPPVLCATDYDIVSCNKPTLRRTCPRDRTGSRTTITQVALTAAAPTALHTCTQCQCIASHIAPTVASTVAPSATPP